jgi:hypothetical protein
MKKSGFLSYFLFINPIFWGLGYWFLAWSTPTFAGNYRSEHTIAGIDFSSSMTIVHSDVEEYTSSTQSLILRS